MGRGETYEEFVEKFKPKKTTDDCITPPLVYDTIRDWVCSRYNIDPSCIVRPFWPGGDYESYTYPEGCVVLDNPPFSILSKICGFYLARGISFFLFAPSLTALSCRSIVMRVNHIICDAQIVYENGAMVRTSFVSNMDGDIVAQTAPHLTDLINEAVNALKKLSVRELPKYYYPDHVLTAAMLQRYSKHGIEFSVKRGDCELLPCLDAQKAIGKSIYGGGLLLSDRKATERAAAERAAAERAAAERATENMRSAYKWELSDKERELIAKMSQ